MNIKNGDLPAMPTNIDAQTLGFVGRMANMEDYYRQQAGLTKREHIAAMAMAAILSKPDTTMSYAAREGVMFADELLAELERTK